MKEAIRRLRETRFFKWQKAGPLLCLLFPIVIAAFAELGQSQSLAELFQFATDSFRVFLFSCLLTGIVYWSLSLLIRRMWISTAITGVLFMTIAIVEFYKYAMTGSHFLFGDLSMVTGVADVTKFAKITFNPLLFILCILTILYIFAVWLTGYRLKGAFWKRCSACALMAGMTAIFIMVPAFFAPVCKVFGIDNTVTYNSYGEAERFKNNKLITNFTVSINQTFATAVTEPEEYSEEAIEEIFDDAEEDALPAGANTGTAVSEQPNVIFIMSESYADFRRITSDLENAGEIYAGLDAVAAEGVSGTSVVPTFGNGTVKTEFELMFGLPVKSLGDAGIPHKLLKSGVEQDTFANMYKYAGYNTTYIHPFRSTFYDREDVYSEYGFDRMIFENDFTVETENFRDYIDDATAFRQAQEVMESTDGPDYIHITTMQNHQPFIDGVGEEVDNYFEGIQLSNEKLREWTEQLKNWDEPVILVFTGDHFPFFSPECDFYNEIGITVDNCSKLYEKTWIVWNNYGADTSMLPGEEKFSTFYLPHFVYQMAGLDNPFVDVMLEEYSEEPLYSMSVNPTTTSELLDLLTYDRTIGENYSEIGGRKFNFND